MRSLNRAEPVTLVLSPTLTNNESDSTLHGSSPESLSFPGTSGISRGGWPETASAIALMWSGVVPQQPPTMLSQPASAHSPISAAITSGVSSYSPNSFGSPAFG